jgi:hydrogenase expression/formation protein HypE
VTRTLQTGKLPAELLRELLASVAIQDPRVRVGPRVGVDAAVIEFGERLLVAKSDPITFATEEIGWYAVQVNANDLAVMGATPRWFLATLLLPEGITEAEVRALFDSLGRACRELEISLVGGHTEVTGGLDRSIVCGHMLGEADPEELVRSDGARPGERVLLTKAIPLEATAILARERRAELSARGWAPAELDRAAAVLHDPGISVVREARLAARRRAATAMHDPTEGGLATGLRELAVASGAGLRIERERIPVRPDGAALCAAFGLDPLGAIASGSLLLTVPPDRAAELLEVYAREGIACSDIGEVRPAVEGLVLVEGGAPGPLPQFARDEIARLFDEEPEAEATKWSDAVSP